MSELTDALKQIAAVPPGEQSLWNSTTAAWAWEYIEALEKDVLSWRYNCQLNVDNCAKLEDEIDTLEAENKRLRETLKNIRDDPYTGPWAVSMACDALTVSQPADT